MSDENPNFEKEIKEEAKDLRYLLHEQGIENPEDIDRLEKSNDAMRKKILEHASRLVDKIEKYFLKRGCIYDNDPMKDLLGRVKYIQRLAIGKETVIEKLDPQEAKNDSWRLKVVANALNKILPKKYSVAAAGFEIQNLAGKRRILVSIRPDDSLVPVKTFITDEKADLITLARDMVRYYEGKLNKQEDVAYRRELAEQRQYAENARSIRIEEFAKNVAHEIGVLEELMAEKYGIQFHTDGSVIDHEVVAQLAKKNDGMRMTLVAEINSLIGKIDQFCAKEKEMTNEKLEAAKTKLMYMSADIRFYYNADDAGGAGEAERSYHNNWDDLSVQEKQGVKDEFARFKKFTDSIRGILYKNGYRIFGPFSGSPEELAHFLRDDHLLLEVVHTGDYLFPDGYLEIRNGKMSLGIGLFDLPLDEQKPKEAAYAIIEAFERNKRKAE